MKKYLMLLISLPAFIAAAIVSFQLLSGANNDFVAVNAATECFENTETEYITVKEFNERIGLFKDGEETPFSVIEVYTFTLPEFDKTILKRGFKIESADIESIIQDYTG